MFAGEDIEEEARLPCKIDWLAGSGGAVVCLAGVGVESGVPASPAPSSGSGGGPFQVRLAGWSLAGWLPVMA